MATIRVLYRWQVDPARREDFSSWWHEGTIRIRQSRPGALGSTLLGPVDDPSHMVGLARWRSREDLEAFWSDAGGTAFAGASLQSTEVFEELDDLTLP